MSSAGELRGAVFPPPVELRMEAEVGSSIEIQSV